MNKRKAVEKDADLSQDAKRYSFLLLKFRPRSEKEIRERLHRKNFPQGIIEQTVIYLKEKKFLDDRLFAKSWIDYRLNKPFGLYRVQRELSGKGIDREIIRQCVENIKKGYSEEAVVERLAREKLAKVKSPDRKKAKARVYAFLLRRGFSPCVVIDAVNRIIE